MATRGVKCECRSFDTGTLFISSDKLHSIWCRASCRPPQVSSSSSYSKDRVTEISENDPKMPRKGMRSVFFKPSSPSHNLLSASATPPRMSFSESLMEDRMVTAEILISKWNSDTDFAKFTSLFDHDRQEASLYLKAVRDLHSAMRIFIKQDPASNTLLRAQSLLQTAMIRLETEFYQILAVNRNCLDPESVSARSSRVSALSSLSELEIDAISEHERAGETIKEVERAASLAMADLKEIADCMISLGYGNECVKIYRTIRKSIVDEGIYRLGLQRFNASKASKIDWEVVEMKIENWIKSAKIAVTILFNGERLLCDHVFSGFDCVRESCFSEISRDGALILFGLPELVASLKKTPEKIFRTLDVYEAMAELWPEIESIFSIESAADIRNQAMTTRIKLRDSIRTMLEDLESAIRKENLRSLMRGGRVHPLTRYVMNYLSVLGDSDDVLNQIADDWPLKVPSPLPASFFCNLAVEEGPRHAIAVRFAWLVLVVLCKLDDKAKLYKDVSLTYLFLANNLQYVVNKVCNSNLQNLLGNGWIDKQKARVMYYASTYQRSAWANVAGVFPEISPVMISPAEGRKKVHEFCDAFDKTYRKQSSWVVLDRELRNDMKASISRMLLPRYTEFYEEYGKGMREKMGRFAVVRFTPDDLRNYLFDLFHESVGA